MFSILYFNNKNSSSSNSCFLTIFNFLFYIPYFDFLRVHVASTYPESFTVKDAITEEVVLTVDSGNKMTNDQRSTVVCLTGTKYTVTVECVNSYWQPNAFLYINTILHSSTDIEIIQRINYDSMNNIPSTYSFNVHYSVKADESWSYKMGEVPTNWYSMDVSSWPVASSGSFPDSSNQIQLYRKSFTVSAIENVGGIVLSLKYQYGVLVYLNNHEVFRKGISGTLYLDNGFYLIIYSCLSSNLLAHQIHGSSC